MSIRFCDRPLVYVAGPYTNPDPVYNTHAAVKLGDELQQTGLVTCLVPHLSLLSHAIVPHNDVNHWYEHDLATLARCDALYRMPGASSGADAEVEFAGDRGLPVFTDRSLLLEWAQQRGFASWWRNRP